MGDNESCKNKVKMSTEVGTVRKQAYGAAGAWEEEERIYERKKGIGIL